MLERARDVWAVDKLDLPAYLARIGYDGPRAVCEATLTALYRAHLSAIRFENLDVFLRGVVAVDLESIQEKIVCRGRGGYCYEQAQLFGAALERLGFFVDRLLARVGPDDRGPVRPRTHLTLRIAGEGGMWLADIGFGSSPPAPLNWRRLGSGGSQDIDGWIYELLPDQDHGEQVWKLREYQAGAWVTLHRWDDTPVHPADVVLCNHYTATHPDSWFTWQPVVVKRSPGAITSLRGRTYTVTVRGHSKTPRHLTDAEFAAALTGEFDLPLNEAEIAVLVAAPTGR